MSLERTRGLSPARTMILAIAALVSASAAAAQQSSRFFPSSAFAPAISADPREPSMGGRVLTVLDPATLFGIGIEGEATIGTSVALLRLAGDATSPTAVLAIQGGVYGRFLLETKDRHLISTDWTFAIPVFFWFGPHWLRVRYRHMSSHVGDEYLEEFNVVRSDFSRDVAAVTGYVRVTPQFAIYGGPDIAFNVEPNGGGRWGAQGGIELRDSRPGRAAALFGGADVRIDEDSNWRPRLNLQTGMLFLPEGATRLRLLAEVGFGPSRQGEFNRFDETVFGMGLVIER